ncbi:ATP-binding protein [Verrucomicrobia bacterium LW23]|nr:ATP-binding protein [Verrucomicrobia bacterium LW23]
MLSAFYIKNFRSILELELDFSYGEGKAPNGYRTFELLPFHQAGKERRLVPCMAYFGANASGKSNILKALSSFMHFVGLGREISSAYEPNLLHPKFQNSTFAAEFVRGDLYRYEITFNGVEIEEEKLVKGGEELFAIQYPKSTFAKRISSDQYSDRKLREILKVECSDGRGRQTKPFLNRIGTQYAGLNRDLSVAFFFICGGIVTWIPEAPFPLATGVSSLALVSRTTEKDALRLITEFVRRLDVDIAAIEMDDKDALLDDLDLKLLNPNNFESGFSQSPNIRTSHLNVAGGMTYLDFHKHSSNGTKRLAGLVGLVLCALRTGGILAVDEIECSLHPLLLREIVRYFKSREHNINGAQLIFSTHNTDILDDSILRVSEIALVRKTLMNGTMVKRLVDFREDEDNIDIRNVTNFRKQYLRGYYSGIPHPAL